MFEKIDKKKQENEIKKKHCAINNLYFENWIKKIKLNQDETLIYDRISITNNEFCIQVFYIQPKDYHSTVICAIVDKTNPPYEFEENLPKALNTIMGNKEKCLTMPQKCPQSKDHKKDRPWGVYWN